MNSDIQAIAQALDLARQASMETDPNPRVGCVLLDANGKLIGRGFTQTLGGPHAEIMALRDAEARNCPARIMAAPARAATH
jgi:diaminohydroxyphosphoribosylaminopyrimidine deaminase/5-amino-6-(5-phosphoribosylamino)uracil reductase